MNRRRRLSLFQSSGLSLEMMAAAQGSSSSGVTHLYAVNPSAPSNANPARTYTNLLAVAQWQNNDAGYANLPSTSYDSNGLLINSNGSTGLTKVAGKVTSAGGGRCRLTWTGGGGCTISMTNGTNGSGTSAGKLLEMDFAENASPNVIITITNNAAFEADPPRNMMLALTTDDTSQRFHPDWLAHHANTPAMRFMDWFNTPLNSNGGGIPTPTWAGRPGLNSEPASQKYATVRPWEDVPLIAAALNLREVWVCIPWDYSDADVTSLATFMRDNVPSSCKVAFELHNETWNTASPFTTVYNKVVTYAAGLGGLGTADNHLRNRRGHGHRFKAVMALVSAVFSGQMSRLVRVLAFQADNPQISELTNVNTGLTSAEWDEESGADYWGHGTAVVKPETTLSSADLDLMFARIPTVIYNAVTNAATNTAAAVARGKKYRQYEAGQHVMADASGATTTLTDAERLTLMQNFNRDSRMRRMMGMYFDDYRRRVHSQMADPPYFYFGADFATITKSGAWGLKESIAQADSAAPKQLAYNDAKAGNYPAYAQRPFTASGTRQDGSTLTLSPTTMLNATGSATISWLRDGVTVGGQTASTYLQGASDIGTKIEGRLTATDHIGTATDTTFNDTTTQALFTPTSLFSGGEQGFWLDPSDFSSMFQDTAGTTPVTATGQSVARINDKSGRGNHFTQSTAGSRPVLQQDGNGKYYLDFDGTDDFLQSTSTINYSATDNMCVCVGATKESDAAAGALIELSASSTTNAGTFAIFAPSSATPNYAYRSRGTSDGTAASGASYASPNTSVLFGYSDISSDSSILRVNGAVAATQGSDQGTGNYGTHTVYIGRRAGTSIPFNGRLYQAISLARTPTGPGATTEIGNMESYVANKTGVTL